MGQHTITEHITWALGRGFSRPYVISSVLVAILCLFYIYSAASFAQLRVYPLIDRVTYYAHFVAYVTSEYADHVIIGSLLILWVTLASKRSNIQYAAIGVFAALFASAAAINYDAVLDGIALASLPAVIALIIYNKYSSKKILNHQSPELTLNYLAIVGIVIGVMGLVLALIPVFFPDPLPQPPVRNYGYEILLVLSSFTPALILLLITCVPVKVLSDSIVRSLKIQQVFSDLHKHNICREYRITYLALIMLLSALLAVIPHLSTVNPDSQQVGVDTGYYVTWVNTLHNSQGLGELLQQAFVVQNQGDRPLSLLFLYMLDRVSHADLFVTVEYVSLILAPALVLVTFFLTRELTSNDIASLFAAFITAVSFHTLIGIYAGFYANWLALIFGYLSLVFLLRFLKGKGITNLILYGSLTTLVLFTHVYTWSVLSIAAGILLVVGIARPGKLSTERKSAILLMAVLLSVVGIDIGRTALIGSSGGIERDLEIAGGLVGSDQFLLRWNNLSYTTTAYVGGIFANFLILALGIYWLVRTRVYDRVTIFAVVFLSLGILPFVIGEYLVQTRVFYDIPFQIPAAVALALVMQNKKGLVRIMPICIMLVLAGTIAVSNYYFIDPAPLG